MVAQPALQQGRLLGENLARLLAGQPLQPFHYDDKGAMATIGRNHAVADVKLFGKEFQLQGFVAWLAWGVVHVVSLIGFRNRLRVLLQWTWSYLTHDKGLRYIIGKVKPPLQEAEVQDKAIV
jgi:NADH dehydrogenase